MRRLSAALIATLLLSLVSPRAADAGQVVATYAVGAGPFGIVSDPTDGRVYVATSGVRTGAGNGNISIIDPATGLVTSQDTSKPAGLLALDPAARRLYASNSDSSDGSVSLDVIDLSTGHWLANLAIGGLGVALDTTRGRAFVAAGRYLASVDTTTFAMNARSAPFPESWFGVATDPSRGRVYVTNVDASHPSLVVLDATDLHTIADVSLPSAVRYGLAVDSARNRVYLAGPDASGLSSTVSILDGASFALRSQALPFFAASLAVSTAAHRIYVTDFDGKDLVALDDETLATAEPATHLPWSAYFATFARDGLLYVSAPGASTVGAIDVAVPQPPVNRPPVIDSATVTPTQAFTNDVVTVSVRAHDPDGDPVTLSYQWSVNHVDRPGETGPSLDLSKPGNGDRNDLICVDETASDGALTSTTGWCMLFVTDSAPVSRVTLDDLGPKTGAVLHASATATDADGDPIATYAFTWTVNGTVAQSSTSARPTDAFDLGVAGHGDSGDTVVVSVIASDDLRSGEPASASATVRNTAPTLALTLRDESPWKHDKLLAAATVTDPDAQTLTYTFTWSVNGIVKQATTGTDSSSAFDLRAARANNGDDVTVDLTVSDGAATAMASASAVVTPPGH